MATILTSIRLPPEMLKELRALAKKESHRRGEQVSWAGLLREAATNLLKRAKSGPRRPTGRGDRA
jgi:hypothetical protein